SFQLDLGPDVHEATLRVREPDGTFLPHDRALELPLRGPLELDVGPTYSFDFGDSAVETSELVARFIEGERTVDSAPLRRNSRHPWARFGPEVAALTSSGPFRVEVASAGGFAAGRAKVTRTVGIEPEPLRMELAPLGRLELRFESRPSDPRPVGWLRIERIDGAERRRLASLDATRPVDAGRTVLDLTPGAYEWTYGSRSGAFAVAAEETTRVVVETPPDRFAASIEIDRSALPPGLAVETAFALGEVGSLGQEFILTHPDAKLLWHDSPTYDFTLASGSWSARCIPHAATDPGSRVPSIGAAFEPELLTPNTPNVTCRLFVDDPIRTASLRVTGTDASGEPARVQVEILRDAGGRVRADGLRWSQTGTPIEIPVERRRNSVLVVVRCEGHEARVARLNAGSSHEITMSRGNTEPVFVVDATHGAPAVGVDVWINGSSIGPTDERGIALFRGTEIPVDFEVYTGRALRTIVGESPSDTPILYVR
ncbi:MAG: NfeD family protein, partial [Planctomycetota bacterium]